MKARELSYEIEIEWNQDLMERQDAFCCLDSKKEKRRTRDVSPSKNLPRRLH